MIHDPNGRISLHPHDRRVQVWAGDALIADTRNAIELRETGYPPRQYLPREDVAMQRLTRTDSVTHCPFKGDASYYAIELDDDTLADAAWSYEAPFEAVAAIQGRLAFDSPAIEEQLGD
ncbi:DUF427 domain-containing protein [Modicisalibacter radicis]|uniref:DUF427 domain-containing protein n=1 Tax=Halomonas sp. EAR18 TaxID=2518972 RepID=UPI00109D1618|nr:DUF427 domain-containing protein [Halomonas sp. EAR18]